MKIGFVQTDIPSVSRAEKQKILRHMLEQERQELRQTKEVQMAERVRQHRIRQKREELQRIREQTKKIELAMDRQKHQQLMRAEKRRGLSRPKVRSSESRSDETRIKTAASAPQLVVDVQVSEAYQQPTQHLDRSEDELDSEPSCTSSSAEPDDDDDDRSGSTSQPLRPSSRPLPGPQTPIESRDLVEANSSKDISNSDGAQSRKTTLSMPMLSAHVSTTLL